MVKRDGCPQELASFYTLCHQSRCQWMIGRAVIWHDKQLQLALCVNAIEKPHPVPDPGMFPGYLAKDNIKGKANLNHPACALLTSLCLL